MDVQQVIDMGREAVLVTLVISAPVLLAGMAVGLAVGLLQALTQVQDQTVSFVPKIVAMVMALFITLPWLIQKMSGYVEHLFVSIPGRL